MGTAWRGTIVRCCVCLAVAGCSGGDHAAGSAAPRSDAIGRPELRAVRLPDLSRADAALRERLRAAESSLRALQQSGADDSDLAAAYGRIGKLLVAAEFLEDAEPYLLNAQALAPADMTSPYYLAHVARLRGRLDDAIAGFERSLTLRADYVPALVWAGVLHLDSGRIDVAIDMLDRAVALQPASAAVRLARGKAALAAGDYAAARAHLEAALSAAPSEPRVLYPLSLAYRGLGDDARAAIHLRKWEASTSPSESLRGGHVPPDDPLMEEIGSSLDTAVALELRGTTALDAGQWQEAAALFREGLRAAPGDATLHQNLGTALYLGGNAAEALASFQEAARLSPGYARAHYSIGVVMDARGRDGEAIRHFEEAVSHEPQMSEARFALAEVLRRTGSVEASLPHYDAIVSADPGASQARFGRAMALVRLGRYRDARATLEEAVRLHPDQPGLPHALARVLAAAPDDAVRDGARAVALAERLYATYGGNATLLETMAMALAETGRFRDAAQRQREAITAATAQRREDLLPVMTENLHRYEAEMPCRRPWADSDAIHRPRPRETL